MQKVQAYLKMIAHKVFNFPMQIKKRLITEKAVKLAVMVRMKLTVRTTTCITWPNYKDLQHNASWCEIQWNVQNSHPPHTTCTFYLTFVETSAFFAIIDGALSVATPTARDQYIPILFSTPTRELKILAVVVSIIGTNPRNSSVTDKVSSTPRMNMACATSEMSVLSSSATENITNDLTFFSVGCLNSRKCPKPSLPQCFSSG